MAAYYAIFYFPPRLVGVNDPDRFYHLGLSKLISVHGLIRILPQVEDLGWASYFPDKEFLFHVLTGAAFWAAGPLGVLLLVPMLGIGIILCLYLLLVRVVPAWQAAILTLLIPLLSPGLIFRITLLRPHLLSILFFCLLLAGILRGRAWLAALAAAGFALSYHAFYIPVAVIAAAALFPWPSSTGGARRWQWATCGLVCGILLNPYFPSTLGMSLQIIKIAWGAGLPPGLVGGDELRPLSFAAWLEGFGFLPVSLLGATALIFYRKIRPTAENAGFWFLFVLSALFTLLSLKSTRASEYAIPCIVLLTGYTLHFSNWKWWLPVTCFLLVLSQIHSSWNYYQEIWSREQGGNAPLYFAGISLLPAEADGKKVFNCQWESGAYLLYARPAVRFVDVLDPALLWHVSPEKYLARERLLQGRSRDPYVVLRKTFKADYVLCGTPALNSQLEADPLHFKPITSPEPTGPIRVFAVSPD